MTNQGKWLAGLLGCLCLAGVYAYVASPEMKRAEVARGNQVRPVPRNEGTEQHERIRFDLLEGLRAVSAKPKQDIFRPLFERPAPVTVRQPEQKPVVPVYVVPSPPQPQPVPQASPQEAEEKAIEHDLATFIYRGGVQKKGFEKVFLKSEDEIFVVGVGETFGAKRSYLVEVISPEELRLREQTSGRLVTIPLRDQEKLVPAFR